MSTRTPPITDPKTLRAVASKPRMQVYEALLSSGPMTVSAIADRMKMRTGSASYHLRVLGEHGFAELAPELSTTGREKWWRAVPGGIRWSDLDSDSVAAEQVARQAESALLEQHVDTLRRAFSHASEWDQPWREAVAGVDRRLVLSATEAKALHEEVLSVLDRFADGRQTGTATSAERADGRNVVVMFHLLPTEPAPGA